jgi:hypothetical protein
VPCGSRGKIGADTRADRQCLATAKSKPYIAAPRLVYKRISRRAIKDRALLDTIRIARDTKSILKYKRSRQSDRHEKRGRHDNAIKDAHN